MISSSLRTTTTTTARTISSRKLRLLSSSYLGQNKHICNTATHGKKGDLFTKTTTSACLTKLDSFTSIHTAPARSLWTNNHLDPKLDPQATCSDRGPNPYEYDPLSFRRISNVPQHKLQHDKYNGSNILNNSFLHPQIRLFGSLGSVHKSDNDDDDNNNHNPNSHQNSSKPDLNQTFTKEEEEKHQTQNSDKLQHNKMTKEKLQYISNKKHEILM